MAPGAGGGSRPLLRRSGVAALWSSGSRRRFRLRLRLRPRLLGGRSRGSGSFGGTSGAGGGRQRRAAHGRRGGDAAAAMHCAATLASGCGGCAMWPSDRTPRCGVTAGLRRQLLQKWSRGLEVLPVLLLQEYDALRDRGAHDKGGLSQKAPKRFRRGLGSRRPGGPDVRGLRELRGLRRGHRGNGSEDLPQLAVFAVAILRIHHRGEVMPGPAPARNHSLLLAQKWVVLDPGGEVAIETSASCKPVQLTRQQVPIVVRVQSPEDRAQHRHPAHRGCCGQGRCSRRRLGGGCDDHKCPGCRRRHSRVVRIRRGLEGLLHIRLIRTLRLLLRCCFRRLREQLEPLLAEFRFLLEVCSMRFGGRQVVGFDGQEMRQLGGLGGTSSFLVCLLGSLLRNRLVRLAFLLHQLVVRLAQALGLGDRTGALVESLDLPDKLAPHVLRRLLLAVNPSGLFEQVFEVDVDELRGTVHLLLGLSRRRCSHEARCPNPRRHALHPHRRWWRNGAASAAAASHGWKVEDCEVLR
mmetsp:Transcript_78831/g.255700  ORF Transcript_78831/g.255700 Transcript_78831/m.255700 type:complete len:521 (-) Transcript_78831:109-1671(-)